MNKEIDYYKRRKYNFKRCRESLNLFQKDVAQDTGLTVSTISYFENYIIDSGKLWQWYFEHGLTDFEIKE